MKKNLGLIDKLFRLLIAAAIVVLFFFTEAIPGTLGIILLVAGSVLALTSFVGTCPIYLALKLSTKKKE